MGRKVSNLVSILTMLTMVVATGFFSGCEKMKMDEDWSAKADTVPPAPPVVKELEFTFDYSKIENGRSAEISWTAGETTNSISERGKVYVSCSHERDKYAAAKDVSLSYSTARTDHNPITVTVVSTKDRKLYQDSVKTTSQVEDGNIIYCNSADERIERQIGDSIVALPYVQTGKKYLKAINQLPGTTNYRTRGDEFKADSVCREFVWVIPCKVIGYEMKSKPNEFELELRDTIRVYQMEKNDIAKVIKISEKRIAINETDERCDVEKEYQMKDKSTHRATESAILKRKWTPKDEYDLVVDNFEFTWRKDNGFSNGSASQVRKDGNFTISGRTDTFTARLNNQGDVNPIDTDYKFYHEKAVFADEYGVTATFDFIVPATAERNTSVSDAEARNGYSTKRLNNAISTNYLDYVQDVAESVFLLKQNAYIKHEDWDKSKCTETITDDAKKWHLEYVTDWSDGKQDRLTFDFSDTRVLKNLGPWASIEANKNYTTSDVSVKLTSTTQKSEEKNGASAKWGREFYDLVAKVTLAGSTQNDKWQSEEPNGFEIVYHNNKFTFEKNKVSASGSTDLKAGAKENNYQAYNYTNTLKYVVGNNTKTSPGTGTIKVQTVEIESEDWDKSKCTETITDGAKQWHLEYVTNWSNGKQDRVTFDFSDTRVLKNLGPWASIEDNKNYTTSNVNVKLTSTTQKSEDKNGASAKWGREFYDLVAKVTLAGSTQNDKWQSEEPNGFEVVYRNKKFTFNKTSVSASGSTDLKTGSKENNYQAYNYTNTLKYVVGNNTKTSQGNGTIKVKSVEIVSENWDNSRCTETITDGAKQWHLEYVTNWSDGKQDRVTFDFSDTRVLKNLGPWASIEANNNYTTSNVSVKLTSTTQKSADKNGASAKWGREFYDLVAKVTLAGSTQNDKWQSEEPNGFEVVYRNKKFTFNKTNVSASNSANRTGGSKSNGYYVYDYTDLLRYVCGNNTKTSQGTGTIKVKVEEEEPTFFPPEWGDLLFVEQTVVNNPKHNGYRYCLSHHFRKGVLPVIITPGSATPDWHFEYFEYRVEDSWNSAVYQEGTGKWINATAEDKPSQMFWLRDGLEKANKSYSEAADQGWDDGRKVNGHPSTSTSRYQLKVEKGRLTATDTYTGVYMGSWK